jgi:hypothetical protein
VVGDGDIDPNWYKVVYQHECPYCGDHLKMIIEKTHTLYSHDGGYRGWCKDTNFVNGKFRVTNSNPWFLNDGYGWGGA